MKEKFTGFYDAAYQWLLTYGPKIILAIIVFFVAQWLIHLLRKWINRFFLAPRFKQVRPFLQGLIATTLQLLLILVIMQILRIQMTIFAAIITAFGVAAGFALSGTLQNFASVFSYCCYGLTGLVIASLRRDRKEWLPLFSCFIRLLHRLIIKPLLCLTANFLMR